MNWSNAFTANSVAEMEKPRSLLWRMSSGLYNTSKSAVTGTVGMGYGGVKWVAGTSYNVTSAVVSGIHIFQCLELRFHPYCLWITGEKVPSIQCKRTAIELYWTFSTNCCIGSDKVFQF